MLKPVLNVYLLLLKARRLITGLAIAGSHKYFYWLKAYSLPMALIIIIIIASTSTIMAKNIDQETYGTKSIIAKLVGSDEEQQAYMITEQGLAYNNSGVSHYIEDQGALQNPIATTPFGSDEIESFYSLTQGESALIAPSIKNPDLLATNRDSIIAYTVESGDTISTIASKFNISANTILWENNLTLKSMIKPGQKLNILPTSGVKYAVQKGETVAAIAKKFQSDSEQIVTFNKLASASDIRTGETLIIPNGVKPAPAQAIVRPSQSIIKKIVSPQERPQDIGTALFWPVLSKRITQYYSWKHTGLDVGDKIGNPIYAAESGKVIRAGWTRGYGYNVVIDHGNGMQTLYGHASKLLVQLGQSVSRGEEIAEIGSTGWSTGPHLHVEVKINGSRVNPLNYLR